MLSSPFPKLVTVAVAASFALTACSGGKPNKIDSSDKHSKKPVSSPSRTAQAPAAGKRPTITLPADLKLTFDWPSTGNATQDAVLSDSREYMRAIMQGSVQHDVNDPAYRFYSQEQAAQYAFGQIKGNIDEKVKPTGTFRFYRAKVAVHGPVAGVTYCSDQTKAFSKEAATGKVLRTAPSDHDFGSYNIGLEKVGGVWKSTKISVREDVRCKG